MLKRSLLVIVLLFGLTLTACFGGGQQEDAPAAPTATEAPTVAPTAAPTTVPTEAAVPSEEEGEATPIAEATAAATAETSAQTSAEARTFQIDPEQSEARFIVDEVLFGNPNTVVGRTSEVSGQLEIDPGNPSQSSVGEIQINAASLVTDNRFRNRSINRMILQSNRDEYQFIIFTPTTIEGLPDAASAGDSFEFQITGDLKIREIVRPVTFDVSITADSETEISGLAGATVLRSDFDLTIPNVDGVADVTDEVRLELEFVATADE
jgi:polyisoprenoid-binding protein YceI